MSRRARPFGGEVQSERKPADARQLLRMTARKANTLAVIDFVLSHTLRLFHPFLPFITEELWHGMGYAEDMPENQGGKTIMFAPWPKPLDDDFNCHYGLTTATKSKSRRAIRTGRAGPQPAPRWRTSRRTKKSSSFSSPPDPRAANDVEVLKLLLNAEAWKSIAQLSSRQKARRRCERRLGELFLPLEGLMDMEAEKVAAQEGSRKKSRPKSPRWSRS